MRFAIRGIVLGCCLLTMASGGCDPKGQGASSVSDSVVREAVDKAIEQKLPQHVFLEERVRAVSQQFEKLSAKLEEVTGELTQVKQRCADLARDNEALAKKNDELDQAVRLLAAQAVEAASTPQPEPEENAERTR